MDVSSASDWPLDTPILSTQIRPSAADFHAAQIYQMKINSPSTLPAPPHLPASFERINPNLSRVNTPPSCDWGLRASNLPVVGQVDDSGSSSRLRNETSREKGSPKGLGEGGGEKKGGSRELVCGVDQFFSAEESVV